MRVAPQTRFILQGGMVLTPDTCVSIGHGSQAEATTHPVEDGSSIADHVIRKPNTLSLTTNWTPRPIDETYFPTGTERGLEAFQILSNVLQSRKTLTIEADGIIYDNMVLQSVSMPRAFEDGDGRTVQIEAIQIQIVSGKIVSVKVSNKLKGKAKKKKTNVTPEQASAALKTLAQITAGAAVLAVGGAATVLSF